METPGAPDRETELARAAASGLMALTGRRDGPPLAPPAGMVTRLEALSSSVRHWSAAAGGEVQFSWESLLTGRAALLGLGRRGRQSANGSCRLVRARDGWVVVNLGRDDDVAAVGAVVGRDRVAEPWEAIEDAGSRMAGAELVSRVRLLGIPGARLGEVERGGWTARRLWPGAAPRLDGLRVVDLSSMWAGPLVALMLSAAGATVTKVESAGRPDGARAVDDFYRFLHPPGQLETVVDFTRDSGRRRLRRLVAEADVVIESSRPRALEQLGAGPFDIEQRAGRVWVSITGYGRDAPGRQWVAFGDDAAVAGGLVAWDAVDVPVFCGDAVADPVTGMTAGAAVFQALARGGGFLVDVSLARSAASLVSTPACGPVVGPRARRSPGGQWQIEIDGKAVAVRHPRIPVAS